MKDLIMVLFTLGLVAGDQVSVDYLAKYLRITYTVLDNFVDEWRAFSGEIKITNEGPEDFQSKDWNIYFSSIRVMEADKIYPNGTELGMSGLSVYHINGYLHKIAPNAKFKGFRKMDTMNVSFKAKHWIVSKTDVMPNWYVAAPGADARVIVSTAGESLRFVSNFDTANKWKRQPNDKYDPYTPEARLEANRANDWKMAPKKVVPTPAEASYTDEKIEITSNWVIVKEDDMVDNEANYLAERLKLVVVERGSAPKNRYVSVGLGMGFVLDSFAMPVTNPEAYTLNLNGDQIIITGVSPAAVFYGIQTLLSLNHDPSDGIPSGYVLDFPRFPYRGMHMDVARNFHGKSDVLRHLQAMATYKLNKFHFHLTDDEGWRLEIPGLPELTEVGGNRCHDPEETSCLLPQLGSRPSLPNTGSGFYTREDYREILAYAAARHIEVIPEFDMPGHGRAAIVSMLARHKRHNDTDPVRAAEFLLNDPEDRSEYRSIQEFDDNAINPCVNSTYAFIGELIRGVVALHEGVQPLNVFNFGGDEVPEEAWEDSPACQRLMAGSPGLDTNKDLKRMFVRRVARLAAEEDLDLAGWEDGLMDGNEAYERASLPNQNVYAYFWDNVWEWGRGQRAYLGANAGYKAILAHSTHLYFDFPYEADPEERGYYWAARVTDTRKAFGFTPENIYDNMGVDRMGSPLDREQVCSDFGCTALEDDKVMNVIGMQGQIWTETVRTSEQLDYMVFPRMLAVAERAWHVASWERLEVGEERDSLRQQDWEEFANTLGYKELARLGDMGITYQLPPPGARIVREDELVAGCAYPGLQVEYSVDGGASWRQHAPGEKLSPGATVHLRTRSVDGTRTSRVTVLRAPASLTSVEKPVTLPPGTPGDSPGGGAGSLHGATSHLELLTCILAAAVLTGIAR